jgi:hypothetical protein
VKRVAATVAAIAVAALSLVSCGTNELAAPRCTATQRLGIVAQSVPSAAFVPCVATLPAGWHVQTFEVERARTRLSLRSDRAARPVEIVFDSACDVRGASPVAPRSTGIRSYLHVTSIDPDYRGTQFDVFPGGCLTETFVFARGPHIALIDDLRTAVDLYPRAELRALLRQKQGIRLDP